ncbi:MAG: LysM peptidoglycan-binding domain-containing protein [Candidatus Moranbacteria bacterium]|nr:LysM peptidoglycan-binding domain-containing protein [Candidatus Moranbacteria bacterium]
MSILKINQREESSQELGETMNARFVLFFLVLIGVGFPTLIQADETHVVQLGDTLFKIAKKHQGVSWKEICDENSLPNCDLIRIGKEIRIPSSYKKEDAPSVQPENVATAVPVSISLSESEKISSKESLPEERGVEVPTAERSSSKSIEDVLGSAKPFNPEVKPDEISLDVEIFDRTQEVEKQREEIIALQQQVTEMGDDKERMSSTLRLQGEKISSYTLFIFLSILGNILFFLLLMRDSIKRKLRTRTRFFAVAKSKKEEENAEVYDLQCEINALKNQNRFLGEQIKSMMQRKMLLSINGKSYAVSVSNFCLDKFTKRAIPIITFLSEGKHFTLKIFNVKRFEKWLGEEPGRRFQILDPVIAL